MRNKIKFLQGLSCKTTRKKSMFYENKFVKL